MESPLTVIASEKTTKGGLDANEYDSSFSDKDRLRSLLFRECNDRGKFWNHKSQNSDLPLICCEYKDIRVRIMIGQQDPWIPRNGNVSHDRNCHLVSQVRDFHLINSDEYRASPALFV